MFRLHTSSQNLHQQIYQHSSNCRFVMIATLKVTTTITFHLVKDVNFGSATQTLFETLFISSCTNKHVWLAMWFLGIF